MSFRIRDLDPDGQFLPHLKLELLARIIPRTEIQAVFQECGLATPRVRKLSLEAILWLILALSLYAELSIPAVWARLVHGLRFLWPDPTAPLTALPTKGAFTYRQAQLGVRPLRRLFARICRPLAQPATPTDPGTPGAFFRGLRLVAVDGHTQDVPDTPANRAVFGSGASDRGTSAFPQVRCVSLCECGTHALLDTTFGPHRGGEDQGAQRLLRSVTPEMLVLADAGLYSYALLAGIQERGAHALLRLPANVRPQPVRRLPDGSTLVRLVPGPAAKAPPGSSQLARLIAYTLTDPQAPGYGTPYRLLTSLTDSETFPAVELAQTYHERWEIELTIDEQDTHQLGQHQPASPLRSRTPRGVIQELYGLFLMHYVLRALMHEAARQAEVDPDRLSFVHALRIVQASLPDFELVVPACLPGLFRRLFQDLVRPLLPEREPRAVPRAVRRKVIKWPLKREAHRLWPQPSRPAWAAIRLLHPDGALI